MTYFVILSHLGVDFIVIRDMTNNPNDAPKIAGNAIIIKIVLAALSFIFCLLLSFIGSLIGFFSEGLTLPASIYLASFFLFISFGSIYNCIFHANMKLGLPAFFTALSRLLSLTSIIILVYFKAKLIYIILLFLLFGVPPNVMMGIPELMLFRKFSKRFIKPSMYLDIPFCKKLLKDSLPLALSGFFITVYTRIDQIMIPFWRSLPDLALYSVSVKLSEVALIIPNAFMAAVFPFLAKFFNETNDNFERTYNYSFRYMVSVSIFIASIFTLYPEKLLMFFYTDDYTSGATTLVILSWGLVFVFAGIVNSRILVSAGLQNYDLLFTGLSALVNIILNLYLIPKYGIEGAAIATFFAYATGPIIGLFLKKTKSFSRVIFLSGLKPITASLIASAAVFSFRNEIFISCSVFFVVFWGVMLLIGGITKKDFELLKGIFKFANLEKN
jgi:O-antigen/teichoic acid export membrane protein